MYSFQGLGHGTDQPAPSLTATQGGHSDTELPPSLKKVLDDFLPKSIISLLPEHSKPLHPSLAKEMEEIIKKVVAKETTASEMRVVAKNYSKKKFLLVDGAFFMALEEDLEIIRVIYYLLKCVSPEQAARHIGEFKAMRGATLWNGFQASPEGQESYQTHKSHLCLYGGIKGQAHCILSDLWHKKTAEEKLAYQKYTHQTKTVKSVLFCGLNDTDNPTEESGETTDTENEPQAISTAESS
ncbi:hypothetical protein CROQUDRAFT_132146 [Cronartium quercuum f. sp. fusiforme G11]|uniref:Uncharacterized protein n=1 Tax=Cronartium quercuum f. sp. fusiforme G11 TaxID=708437 RepID=A0A9P6NRE2_9BASI|nr:hypothetical protein CROQUDRAFT_132146 [Cronartium quercuum f. sp. fusiforme G11]